MYTKLYSLRSTQYFIIFSTDYAGAKFSADLLNTEAFARVGVSYAATPIDACKDKDASSLNYWRCVVTVNTASMGHPVGTCRMGAKNRSDTVVDHKLRYYTISYQ